MWRRRFSLNIPYKIKCREHLFPATKDYVKGRFGFDGYGCGLYQTGVPCESGIPGRGSVKDENPEKEAMAHAPVRA